VFKERVVAAASYVGPLSLCAWSGAGTDSSFLDFHLRQAIFLSLAEAIIYLCSACPWPSRVVWIVPAWALCSLSAMGFFKALAGDTWRLPLGLGRIAESVLL
jgi:uncharacterized membrane protein